MASERKDSFSELTLSASSSPAKMAVSIAMNGMEERSMSPAQLHINEMKQAMAEQQRLIEMRNAKIPTMLRQQIETGLKDIEDIEGMVITSRMLQSSILRGINLAKAALGEEPFNPRASPMPAAATAAASAAVPAPIAVRPSYKSIIGIPEAKAALVESPKEDDEDGFEDVKSRNVKKLCYHTEAGKHCHNKECTFIHPKDYQPGPRTICNNWNSDSNKNTCKWGNNCKFLHAKKCTFKDGEFVEAK